LSYPVPLIGQRSPKPYSTNTEVMLGMDHSQLRPQFVIAALSFRRFAYTPLRIAGARPPPNTRHILDTGT
jgi:hypothetical protein